MSDKTFKPAILLAFANNRIQNERFLKELRRERDELEKILDQLPFCDIKIEPDATSEAVVKAFTSEKFRGRLAILHYAGHANGNSLLFEGRDGGTAKVGTVDMARFLGEQQGLVLVFLNGCSTLGHVEALHASGVKAVIATRRDVADEKAMALAIHFYRFLAEGMRLEEAFRKAKAAMPLTAISGGYHRLIEDDDDELLSRDMNPSAFSGDTTEAWELHIKPGADTVRRWSLREMADDPLANLPDFPPRLRNPRSVSPYLGLNSFDLSNARLFFGRGREIRELYDWLQGASSAPLLLYYGKTGIGKSSLLEAGLIPRIEKSHTVVHFRRPPNQDVVTALVQEIVQKMDDLGGDSISPVDSKKPLCNLARHWRTCESFRAKPLLVIIDQLDDWFSLNSETAGIELKALLDAIAPLFHAPRDYPRGRLILGFREEWLAEIKQIFNDDPRSFWYDEQRLTRLQHDGVVEAIMGIYRDEDLRKRYCLDIVDGPGKLPFAETLATDLLNDKDAPVAPTLQILLAELWNQSVPDSHEVRVFSLSLYEQLRRSNWLEFFLDQRLAEIEAVCPEAIQSGLVLDILQRHTTERGEAAPCSRKYLEALYPHCLEVLEQVITQAQKEPAYLLVNAPSDDRQKSTTRLIHDTLAPLIRLRFEQSDKPGQRAVRILEQQVREQALQSAYEAHLTKHDLEIVEKGLMGMRARSPDEQRLVEMSRVHWDEEAKKKKRLKALIGALAFVAITLAGAAIWQGQRARSAIDLAVESGNRFLTKVAEELRKTPGIQPQDVNQLYDQGEVYFNEVIAKAGSTPSINRAMAKMHLSRSEASELSDDLEQMVEQARKARQKLVLAFSAHPHNSEDMLALAKSYENEAHGLTDQQNFESALAALKEARTLDERALSITANSPANAMLALAKNDQMLSRLSWMQKQYEPGLAQAQACLDRIKDLPKTTQNSLNTILLQVSCLNTAGLLTSNSGKEKEAREQYYLPALKILTNHPTNVREWIILRHRLLNNVGVTFHNDKLSDLDKALDYYRQAAEAAMKQFNLTNGDLQAKDHWAFYLHNIGRIYSKKGQNYRDKTIEAFQKAYELREELVASNSNNKQWRDRMGDSLNRLGFYLRQTDHYHDFKPIAEAQLAFQQALIDKEPANIEYRADFVDAKYSVCENQENLGEGMSAFECYKQTIKLCDQYLNEQPDMKEHPSAIKFRFFLQYGLLRIAPAKKGTLSVEDYIRMLNEAIEIQENYAKFQNKNWILAIQPAVTRVKLANTLAENGYKLEALHATQKAADAGSSEAMYLLADWYNVGIAPLTVDHSKAKMWRNHAKLGFDDNFLIFNVPIKLSYYDEKLDWPIYIRDPIAEDDPVESEIFRLEYYEGATLPDDIKEKFRKILKIAKESNASFEALSRVALGSSDIKNTYEFYHRLICVAGATEIGTIQDKAKFDLCTFYNIDGVDGILKVIINTENTYNVSLIKESFQKAVENPELRPLLIEIGKMAVIKEMWSIARTVFDALLLDRLNEDTSIDLLYQRGIALEKMGLLQDAQNDFFRLLALRPENPNVLNHLAYNWIETDQHIGDALNLLTRAHRLSPKNPNISDSLGWAYTKLGRIDEALPHLNAAMKGDPKQAEIRYHLGEAHRRGGRIKEAREHWTAALTLNPDDKMKTLLEKNLAEYAVPKS